MQGWLTESLAKPGRTCKWVNLEPGDLLGPAKLPSEVGAPEIRPARLQRYARQHGGRRSGRLQG